MAQEFIISVIISIFMVVLTTIIFYELLYYCWRSLLKMHMISRFKIIIVILIIFTGHTVAVWLYGGAYYIMQHYLSLGTLNGNATGKFMDYVYYSAATYSSLGIGDVFPEKALRFLTGVEVLNGLILITWSASFTYLSMEKFWGKK